MASNGALRNALAMTGGQSNSDLIKATDAAWNENIFKMQGNKKNPKK